MVLAKPHVQEKKKEEMQVEKPKKNGATVSDIKQPASRTRMKEEKKIDRKEEKKIDRREEKKMEVEPEKSKFGFTVADFEQIPSVPVYKCTEAEFKEPMKLLEELRRQGYDEYGCVKLVPPKSFKPPFCFNAKGKLLTTRKQVLQDLSRAEVRNVSF